MVLRLFAVRCAGGQPGGWYVLQLPGLQVSDTSVFVACVVPYPEQRGSCSSRSVHPTHRKKAHALEYRQPTHQHKRANAHPHPHPHPQHYTHNNTTRTRANTHAHTARTHALHQQRLYSPPYVCLDDNLHSQQATRILLIRYA